MTSVATLERLVAARLVPVVTLPDADCAVALGRTLLDAGLPVIEVTLRSSAALPAIRQLRQECPDLLVGAGTVLVGAQVDAALDAGAQFLVAPGTDEIALDTAHALGIPMIPGVMTPSEVGRVRARGLRTLKLFPARPLGGASYLRMLAEVFPDVRFVPSGGIDAAALEDYLAIPAVAACGGTWLAPTELLRERRFDEIWSRVAAAISMARSAVVQP